MRTLPVFPQLPEHVILSGRDLNEILVVSFIGDVLVKKPQTGVSLAKVINP
jgi:hypothetical protein